MVGFFVTLGLEIDGFRQLDGSVTEIAQGLSLKSAHLSHSMTIS